MNRSTRFNLFYVFIAFWGVLLLSELWRKNSQVASIPYSEFETLLRDRKVQEVVIGEKEIRGQFLEAREDKKRHFVTTRVEPELARELNQHGVKYTRVVESTLFRDLLSWIVPVLLFFGIWILIMKKLGSRAGMGGGLMSIGKSKAKVYVENDTKTSFKDVAGVEESKQELSEVVDFLKDPKRYGRLGGRMPKGVLLVGPPGTGKTLLARAVAGEAGVPFFSMSGSEFVEMFVGVGAARVRDLFEQARSKAPCIIFIDELDAMGKARNTHPMAGGHDEKEQTLNQLLVEMDGFDSSGGIVILAATNRPEILDPALLRAGRFDRQVLVDRPDRQGRLEILQVHSRKIRLGTETDLSKVASLTPGFTGADLANLVNEAALAATRRNAEEVSLADFTLAIERITAGLEKKSRLINPREREIVAHHEIGHALVAHALPGADPVHKVSIIPRGIGALGYTMQRPTEDRYLMTRAELENRMTILMGGRVAEQLVYGHLSTGAADDLNRATEIARNMVTRYGMETTLGHITYDSDPAGFLGGAGPAFAGRRYSEETAREIDCAVRALVQRAHGRALRILERNRETLVNGSRALLRSETLTDQDLHGLFSSVEKHEEELQVA